MGRIRRKDKDKKKGFSIFDDDEPSDVSEDEDLPKDEAGRRKIKRQYSELLGVRIEKLKGRILNRERINKSTVHIDFMIGSDDVAVTGLTRDGREVPVLRGGAWQV